MCLSEKGIIITICCPWFQSEQDKSLVRSAINKTLHDSKKVYITWFENGNWTVSADDLVNFLTSNPFPQERSAATNCPPRGIMGKKRLPHPWNYKIYLLSGKTVLVLTRIRNESSRTRPINQKMSSIGSLVLLYPIKLRLLLKIMQKPLTGNFLF